MRAEGVLASANSERANGDWNPGMGDLASRAGDPLMADLVAASVLLAVASTVVVALYGVSFALSADWRPVVVEPFLAGHPPTEHAVSRYHPRWYAATIVFLAFDMEMAFMFPWVLVVAEMGVVAVVEMFGFLAILLVGVVYAWREGAFRWA